MNFVDKEEANLFRKAIEDKLESRRAILEDKLLVNFFIEYRMYKTKTYKRVGDSLFTRIYDAAAKNYFLIKCHNVTEI